MKLYILFLFIFTSQIVLAKGSIFSGDDDDKCPLQKGVIGMISRRINSILISAKNILKLGIKVLIYERNQVKIFFDYIWTVIPIEKLNKYTVISFVVKQIKEICQFVSLLPAKMLLLFSFMPTHFLAIAVVRFWWPKLVKHFPILERISTSINNFITNLIILPLKKKYAATYGKLDGINKYLKDSFITKVINTPVKYASNKISSKGSFTDNDNNSSSSTNKTIQNTSNSSFGNKTILQHDGNYGTGTTTTTTSTTIYKKINSPIINYSNKTSSINSFIDNDNNSNTYTNKIIQNTSNSSSGEKTIFQHGNGTTTTTTTTIYKKINGPIINYDSNKSSFINSFINNDNNGNTYINKIMQNTSNNNSGNKAIVQQGNGTTTTTRTIIYVTKP